MEWVAEHIGTISDILLALGLIGVVVWQRLERSIDQSICKQIDELWERVERGEKRQTVRNQEVVV